MSAAFGTAGAHLAGTAATAAVAVPAAVAANDIILVHIYKENTNAVTPPAGFTEITPAQVTTGNVISHHLFWKRAAAADSGTYTFSWTGSVYREAIATRWTGCLITGTPYDTGTGAPNGAARSSAGTATPAVSLTTQDTNRLLVWSGTNFAGDAWTMPTGFTATETDQTIALSATAYKAQAAAGATGSITGSCATSDRETAWLLALIPEPSGGAGTTTSVRARTASGAAATTSHTVSMPAGTLPGDRLVVGFVNDGAVDTASTVSTGWTSLGSQAQGTTTNHRLTIFTKVATGTDTLTVAVTSSQAARWAAVAESGDGGTPTVQFANGGSATTGTVTAVTGLTVGNYLSLVFLGLDNNVATAHVVTAPSGWSNVTSSGAATDPVFAAVMDQDFTAVASISPGSLTWTNSEQWITAHVAVPAGTGSTRIPTRPRSRRLAALLDM